MFFNLLGIVFLDDKRSSCIVLMVDVYKIIMCVDILCFVLFVWWMYFMFVVLFVVWLKRIWLMIELGCNVVLLVVNVGVSVMVRLDWGGYGFCFVGCVRCDVFMFCWEVNICDGYKFLIIYLKCFFFGLNLYGVFGLFFSVFGVLVWFFCIE